MKKELIAPCGMNCSLCISYQSLSYDLNKKGFQKKYCPGCRPRGKNCTYLSGYCQLLAKGQVEYCFECQDFPCIRLKALDKRYRNKYHMSMIDNLKYIQTKGMEEFLASQEKRWQCDTCGSLICCHNGLCLNCQLEVLRKNKKHCWQKVEVASLDNSSLIEYRKQLDIGDIQKAYQVIMSFMSALRAYLAHSNPDYIIGGLYPGYLDMSYFPCTPKVLKAKGLKIAVVYLHGSGTLELWLSGSNKKIMMTYWRVLNELKPLKYRLVEPKAGVDALVEVVVIPEVDFSQADKMMIEVEESVLAFSNDFIKLLQNS